MNRIEQIEARLAAATPGPWEPGDIYGLVSPTQIDGYAFPLERIEQAQQVHWDSTFIARAPEDLSALLAVVKAVLLVHQPDEDMDCIADGDPYPCHTARVITRALEGP